MNANTAEKKPNVWTQILEAIGRVGYPVRTDLGPMDLLWTTDLPIYEKEKIERMPIEPKIDEPIRN